jgi:hypothetical protein
MVGFWLTLQNKIKNRKLVNSGGNQSLKVKVANSDSDYNGSVTS